jgi:hypothetical protein
MATRRWAGAAPRVAQVQTFAFAGTWEADDYILASFSNGKSYYFLAGSATTNTVVTNMVTAWNALSSTDYPEFAEITASVVVAGTLTLTCDTAGLPFTVTLTPLESNLAAAGAQTIEGAGTATTGTTGTACSSPHHWSIAANWIEGAVPVNADDVVIGAVPAPSIKYGLDQSAVTVATLKVLPGWSSSSEIGLPAHTNALSPTSGYPEYRTQRLAIIATIFDYDSPSRRGRFDLSAGTTTATIRDTGQPNSTLEDALDIKATTTANIHILKGNVGINNVAGDTGTVADLNVSYKTNPASDCFVRLGAGCTLTNLDQSGGEVFILNGATTIVKTDGVLHIQGAVATSLKNRGGIAYLEGIGTIALLENGGECYRVGFAAITITTLRLFAGSRGGAGDAPVTYTNDVEWYECRLPEGPDDRGADVAWWNFGRHKALTPAAI